MIEKDLIKSIIDSGYKANLVVSGGGTHIIPMLLENGGASNFLNEATVPYGTKSFLDYAGYGYKTYYQEPPFKFVSRQAVLELGEKAAYNALYDTSSDKVVGLAASSKLITDNERVGRDNEIYIYTTSYEKYNHDIFRLGGHLKFVGKKTRLAQELTCAKFILWVLYCTVTKKSEVDGLKQFLDISNEDVISLVCLKS